MNKILNLIDKVIKYLIITFLTLMVVLVFMQVIFRFVLNNPLQWSEELSRFLFVWISFLGASLALKQGQHLGIDVFLKLFPRKLSKFFIFLSYIFILIFLVGISYKGVGVLNIVSRQRSASLRIPMIYPYSGVFIGLFLMIINTINILKNMVFGNALDEILDGKTEDYKIDGDTTKYQE
ncbi:MULTISPECIES: TRAP transporter small permease [Halanaerobium]|uniref:TRAP-type C4-dicarboxylate transport system, small permease component n=2 Tax=Halanaerobium congolense TaxID=54121 RepID=A0A1G6T3M8_9FIRM|nr:MULTISPECIES: TRAP transporter small permease [Halanaerobium]PUU87508.1 MAG: tripartite AtP-independent periplasmic transporter subunit DctQ [Halanaerobium sp.]SDD23136.1 TRAP-type C4-dicarboxylate transport system, small permease component [Halanaerobium congolense]SHM98484.1 TRAP-type C4-dicarboxylate transport system, small permease component [Halanaerobium congolense]